VAGGPNCPVFPTDNWWNVKVDPLPVASNSAQIINSIGASTGPQYGGSLPEFLIATSSKPRLSRRGPSCRSLLFGSCSAAGRARR